MGDTQTLTRVKSGIWAQHGDPEAAIVLQDDEDLKKEIPNTWNLTSKRALVSLALMYAFLASIQSSFIQATQEDEEDDSKAYAYDFTFVVFLTEITKLALVLLSILPNYDTVIDVVTDVWQYRHQGVHFIVPAFIYSIYNNATFVNLLSVDGAALEELLHVKIIFTAILFQYIFERKLGMRKWTALTILLFGFLLKEIDLETMRFEASWIDLIKVLNQAFISSLASVYNEYLLKTKTDLAMTVQQIYLYFFSAVFNALFIWSYASQEKEWTADAVVDNFDLQVVPVVLIGALLGIFSALMLKYLDTIWKCYAASFEMLITTVSGALFFGAPVTLRTVLCVGIISASLLLYHRPCDFRPRKNSSP